VTGAFSVLATDHTGLACGGWPGWVGLVCAGPQTTLADGDSAHTIGPTVTEITCCCCCCCYCWRNGSCRGLYRKRYALDQHNDQFTSTTPTRLNSTQLSWLINVAVRGQQSNDVTGIVTSRCCAQTSRCLLAVELSWVESTHSCESVVTINDQQNTNNLTNGRSFYAWIKVILGPEFQQLTTGALPHDIHQVNSYVNLAS